MAVNERVAIVGSGLIGRAWAIVFAGGGCEVALYDAVAGVAEKARGLVAEGLDELATHGLVKDAKAAAARVRAATSLADALAGVAATPLPRLRPKLPARSLRSATLVLPL